MKRVLVQILILVIVLPIISCGRKNKEEKTDAQVIDISKSYSFIKDTSGTVLQWTAYKFTDKVAVKGVFEDFVLTTNEEFGSIEEFLIGDKITINTRTVNSGNEIRDAKLWTHFFQIFNSDTIRGEILNAEKGDGKMTLELNNISKPVDYEYKVQNDTVHLITTIDLANWEGEKAINSLNQECYELHMGADKVSKLWPNVDISLKLPVNVPEVSD